MYVITTIEKQVILGIVKGLTSEQIALELTLKKKAIDDVRRTLKKKLGYNSTIGLLMRALKLGFLNEYLNCVPEQKYRMKESELLTLAEGLFLQLALSDFPLAEIASQMDSSIERIREYQRSVFSKWKVESSSDLVLKAIHKGYIQLTPKTPIGSNAITEAEKGMIWNAIRSGAVHATGSFYQEVYNYEFGFSPFDESSLNYKKLNLLRLRIMGRSDAEIAKELGIQIRTVNQYMRKIKKDLGATTTGDIVKKACRLGILRIIPETIITEPDEIEMSVLNLIADSVPLKEIAANLDVPLYEVAYCINRLKTAWKVASDEGLIVQALRKNAITLKSI